MKDSGSIKLRPLDDLFSTQASREDAQREKVVEIPLAELYPFNDHPFHVKDDDRMAETVESIRQYGVLIPAIARPLDGGGYELISGHRRKHASELAGLETMPVIVRDLDDNAAVIIMVDSNLQRENILPSERAFAYRMKLDAVRRQAGRPANNSRQVVGNYESADLVGKEAGDSGRQVQRYIRLTNLIPELLDMVDERQLAFNPAVELSYLKADEQEWLLHALDATQCTPSLSQAQRIKRFSQEGRLTEDMVEAVMSEEKKPVQDKFMFDGSKFRSFFPKSYTQEQMENTIMKLLEKWQHNRQKAQSL